jgi:SAM-dependent methyltransferase
MSIISLFLFYFVMILAPLSCAASKTAQHETHWENYFKNTGAEIPPRDTVVKAIEILKNQGVTPSLAIDIGSGNGRDTIFMLQAGWQVLAIDASEKALAELKQRAGKYASQLTLQAAFFEDMQLPKTMFINAGYALPFVEKNHFNAMWDKIVAALEPNAVFSGHFFGPEDSWVGKVSTQSEQEIKEHLLKDFEILSFSERKERGNSDSGPKFWHVFNVVAQKK